MWLESLMYSIWRKCWIEFNMQYLTETISLDDRFKFCFQMAFYNAYVCILMFPRCDLSDKLKFVSMIAIQPARNDLWKQNENIFHETHLLFALSLLFQNSSHYLLNKGWNNLMRSDWLGAPNCLLLSPSYFISQDLSATDLYRMLCIICKWNTRRFAHYPGIFTQRIA